MDRIREQITKPVLIGAGVGLVLGLIIGLFFAWMVAPVEWENVPFSAVQPEMQSDYLALAVQNFQQTGNTAEAQRRWNELGADKQAMLNSLSTSGTVAPETVNAFAAAVGTTVGAAAPPDGAATLPAGAATQPAAGGATGTEAPNALPVAVLLLCVLTLGIGGLLFYLLYFRNRRPAAVAGGRAGAPMGAQIPEPQAYAEGQEPPIVQYLTTYTLGNDLYDDSFSIDSPSGEFLGECGVGISDTIGVGDPKKVTAFEVWLFDKNDIQTVTKVVMSQHAFNDPAVSQRLASKGEPVLAEPGKHIVLETATLQLEARVVNMNYGQGALPAGSFFEQVTLELAVWQK